MPRSKSQKAAVSPLGTKFRAPTVSVRTSRRVTLAGPSQFLSKRSFSPVVMLPGDMLVKMKKDLFDVVKAPSKTPSRLGNKAAAKKMGGKHSAGKANTAKVSPRPKNASSTALKMEGEPSSKKTKTAKSSSKPKKASSPQKSRRTANVRASPKPSSPKHQKSLTPKSNKESPSHSYYLRSVPVPSPGALRLEKSKTESTRKPANVAHKRDRSASPANKKKPKVIAASEERKKSPVSRTPKTETSQKPTTGKRKRDTTGDDSNEAKLSPPQKRKLLKSESRSVAKKTEKDVGNLSFTDVKSKSVTRNAMKSEEKRISISQQNSTPVKSKSPETDVSMNWSVSSVKRRLLSMTPYRMTENYQSPPVTNSLPTKSALFSGMKTESSRRQSVRFAINGKTKTVKQLKQRSSYKRLCYRVCQYMLLCGLPVAMTVGSVLVYNGLI